MFVDWLIYSVAILGIATAFNKTALKSKPATKVEARVLTTIIFIVSLVVLSLAKHIRNQAISDSVGVPVGSSNPIDFVGATLFTVMFFNLLKRRREDQFSDKTSGETEPSKVEESLTLVMTSAADGDLQRLRILVAGGELVNLRSSSGSTALMYAARNNREEIVEFLLSVGADPGIKSNKGTTATDIAKRFGHSQVIELLERAASKKA